jgi:hypothetical protein
MLQIKLNLGVVPKYNDIYVYTNEISSKSYFTLSDPILTPGLIFFRHWICLYHVCLFLNTNNHGIIPADFQIIIVTSEV